MGTAEARVSSGARRTRPGSVNDPAKVKRWRWSLGVGPYSRPRSFGSMGPFENGIWSSFA